MADLPTSDGSQAADDSPSPSPVHSQVLLVSPEMEVEVCSGQVKRAHSSSDDVEDGFRKPRTPTTTGVKKQASSAPNRPRSASPAGRGRSRSQGRVALSTSTFLLRFRLSLRVPDAHNHLFPMAFSILLRIMALSIISINVNGMRDESKRLGLVQWLRSLPVTVDVVCLQETHCTSDSECLSWLSSSGFSCVVSPGSVKSCGCIVLYRPTLSLVNSWCDSDGRVSFPFVPKLFVLSAFMPPITTLPETNSLMMCPRE